LKWLGYHDTQVAGLGPVAKLTALQSLDCASRLHADLRPPAPLTTALL
jgi:hypothetical protein